MTTSRSELLQVLSELSERAGELRFGQLVANLATLARGAKVEAIWDAEDEELVGAARRLLAHYRQRQPGGADPGAAADRPREDAPPSSAAPPA
jgi:hypothetical protein